jgi:hypothetical protein
VPYDSNISPVANLYDKPDNLDPQPEYPLRTALTFYKEEDQPLGLDILEGGAMSELQPAANSPFPSSLVLFTLWIFGLIVWCTMFVNPASTSAKAAGGKQLRRKKVISHKDV